MINIELTKCIGPAYYDLFWDLEEQKHLHYWLKGGRGSLKSSFVFIYVIWRLTVDAIEGRVRHGVALRKVKDTIRDSIFQNFLWAIDLLGLTDLWQYTTNPMKIWFKDNTILFRGAANKRDHEKIKSIKFKKGFCKFVIYEELTEFIGMDEIRVINHSLLRGGDEAAAFYMYNPPASKNAWVNDESRIIVPSRYIHSSTYLDAPREWLGDIFVNEAEELKIINPRKYRHMFLGEVVGEGLEIYPEKTIDNTDGVLVLRTITDDEISRFYKVDRGLDFGYSAATCYSESFYNENTMQLFVFDEVYLTRANNEMLAVHIKPKAGSLLIYGDSEDPRTINEMNLKSLNVRHCKKGKDSKPHGIKWMQDRAEIIIDKKRCPNIASDFQLYEYKKDPKTDKIIYGDYPKEPDGCASVRYGQEEHILSNKIRWA